MTNKMLRLSKKIVISSDQDVKTYEVERWYNEYFKEYNYQLEHLGVAVGQQTTSPNEKKITSALEGMYAANLAAKIIQNKPFVDFYGYQFVTPSVKVTSFGFSRNQTNPQLTVYLITQPLELLESYGSILILKHPTNEDSSMVISIELNDSTSIYSIS
ncbi:hypothetical protein [Flavobacterium sp. UBA4120]|uniref:hypothetical protein n=2 Tax=Bacteria TaxID=2 RepID=UPI0025C2E4B8|nr:hypothetical protein [Flavobacterium sp. UBA4120]